MFLPKQVVDQLKGTRTGIRWVFVCLWMGLIFFLSSDPRSSHRTAEVFGDLNLLARKAAHMTEYAILYCLLYFALSGATAHATATSAVASDDLSSSSAPAIKRNQRHWIQAALPPLVIAALYACTDEWHQSFVPGRTSTLNDVLIDSLGACVALAGITIYTLHCNSKSRQS